MTALTSRPRPERSPSVSFRRLAQGLAWAALGAMLVRTGFRVTRELIDCRTAARQLTRRWTRIDSVAGAGQVRLHDWRCDVMTNADPIVLVHGYGIGGSYFVPLAARLSRHAPVFVPDLPGHGRSEPDSRPLTVPELARALERWMDANGLRGAVLVGHSLGCQVVGHLASQRPDLALRLVLIGPTADVSARTPARQALRGMATSAFERPSASAWMALDYGRAGVRLLREEMRAMVADRPEGTLMQVACPVFVVRGARDRIVPQRWAEAISRVSGAPEPVVVPKWGHAVHYDDPDTVAALVMRLGVPIEDGSRTTPGD